MIEAALETLARERHDRSRAAGLVPDRPGLYAFYGDQQAWTELALEPAFDDQPLYVGKAERSLNGRDVRTHFATGKTGSSTVRRSLAALLANDLNLVAVPRNLAKPDGSANFALDPASDARLSTWMESHLRLATWVRPDGLVLGDFETAVVLRLRPPSTSTRSASHETGCGKRVGASPTRREPGIPPRSCLQPESSRLDTSIRGTLPLW